MKGYKDFFFIIPLAIFLGLQTNTYREYNNSFSNVLPSFLAHLVKAVISFFIHKKKYKNYKKVFFVVIFFETQHFLMMKYSKKLTPIFTAICTQSKFVFLCILSIIVLKRKYDLLQYFGLVVIICGMVHGSKLWESLRNQANEKPTDYVASIFTMCSSLCGGISNVFFEKYVRKEVFDFFGYQFVYETISCFFSFAILCVEYFSRSIDIKQNFSTIFLYALVLLSVCGSTLISFASTKICPVKRTILTVIASTVGSIVVQIYRKEAITAKVIISLSLVVFGIFVYEHKNLKIMFAKRTPVT